MAIKNSYEIFIDGRNYTYGAVLPAKIGEFLDEQLDEASISLRNLRRKNFAPLTPVEIRIKNKLYWHDENRVDQERTKTYYFVVANDTAEELPPHSGLYNHELYLIEATKIAERIIVDSLTFTNDIGKYYTANQKDAKIVDFVQGSGNYGGFHTDWETCSPVANPYKTPENADKVVLLPIEKIFSRLPVQTIYSHYDGVGTSYERGLAERNYRHIYKAEDYIKRTNVTVASSLQPSGTELRPFSGFQNGQHYVVEYVSSSIFIEMTFYGSNLTHTTEEVAFAQVRAYDFVCVENKYPLKQRTITDVINRLLDVCEPIHKGETPRFYLNAVQAELFDKIIAPQLSFTKQTLRECLQEAGKVVHGEPRLKPIKKGGTWFYEVSYDLYGMMLTESLSAEYTKQEIKQSINSYCSHVDSNAENIVNQLDRFSGVITEPFTSGYKTVRTESMYARIEETNMLIATQYPIYTVEKLEVGIVPGSESITYLDITPWLFEKSVYDTQLSSYDNAYPFSKKYGLYFTQGQKNIQGLSFKAPDPINSSRESYAIVNILRNAANKSDLSINSEQQDYIRLAFRVTYTPFYDSRIAQSKVYFKDNLRSSGLVYNQQSNIIETHYYGENLKGAIARMGNIEKTVTYLLSNIHHIPKAGRLYDKDYYISTVATEILPTCIKCTIGLSKDFNRLSEFVGISSTKRYSEVSQAQAQERNVLYRNYVVVGAEEGDADAELIGSDFMQSIVSTFQPSSNNKRISSVVAWGEGKTGGNTNAMQLPVVSSAFGNSMSFSWRYEDNYSAGAVAIYGNNGQISGYFQNNAAYCNYFGRIHYYHFVLRYDGDSASSLSAQTETGTQLPKNLQNVSYLSGIIRTPSNQPFLLSKDSREILQINMQVDFVSNDSDLIIGSALAAYNPLVRGYDSELGAVAARLYVFDEPLNKFIDNIDSAIQGINLNELPSTAVSVFLRGSRVILTAGTFPAGGKSWAIISHSKVVGNDVEDESGNVTKQYITHGGNVLLAKNATVHRSAPFETIYFTPKREVFDKTVWKDVI